MNQSLSADEILAAYTEAVSREPKTLRDLVVPHVCLVALSLSTVENLRESTKALPRPEYKWLDYIQRVLIDAYRPVKTLTLRADPRQLPPIVLGSNVTTNTDVRLQPSGRRSFLIEDSLTATRTLILPD